MAEKEIIEIHDTEYIDRELPRITYEKKVQKGMTESENTYISVSDKTSKAALSTFRALREEGEKDNER